MMSRRKEFILRLVFKSGVSLRVVNSILMVLAEVMEADLRAGTEFRLPGIARLRVTVRRDGVKTLRAKPERSLLRKVQ